MAWAWLLLLSCAVADPAVPQDGAVATDAADAGDATTDAGATRDGGHVDAHDTGLADAPPMCPTATLGEVTGRGLVLANTAGSTDHLTLSCEPSAGPDLSYLFRAPASRRYAVEVRGDYDAVLGLLSECGSGSVEIGCNDNLSGADPGLQFDAIAGQSYLVVVSGAAPGGSFALDIVAAEICDNGLDDDGDGRADCASAHCKMSPPCHEAECHNDLDDDGDGRADCDDPDCLGPCTELACDDGTDNDRDGRADCRDPDCSTDAGCLEIGCYDGLDDNDNGLTDCEDPGCTPVFGCTEQDCLGGVDDDGDGLVDCLDPDCVHRATFICSESDCDDGLDDTANGLVDCDDPSCSAAPNCCSTPCPLQDLGSATGVNVASGSSMSACSHMGQERCRGGMDDRGDVTFLFTAPATGHYRMDTLGSDYATALAVHLAERCEDATAATELACGNSIATDWGRSPMVEVEVFLLEGQRVLVTIDNADQLLFGNYALSIFQL